MINTNLWISKGWVTPPKPKPVRGAKLHIKKPPAEMNRMPIYGMIAQAGLRMDGKPRVRKPYSRRHDLSTLTPEEKRQWQLSQKRKWISDNRKQS